MPWLFETHKVGYRDDVSTAFTGEREHWDGVPFPTSPTPSRTSNLSSALATQGSDDNHGEAELPDSDTETIAAASDDCRWATDELSLHHLEDLLPRQVLAQTWPYHSTATSIWYRKVQYHSPKYLGLPKNRQRSPIMFNALYLGPMDGSEPMWISQDFFAIEALENAVRQTAALARRSYNALRSFEMIAWAYDMSPCGRTFPTQKGLDRHQQGCSIFAEEEPGLVNALEIVRAKRERRKRQRLEQSHTRLEDEPVVSGSYQTGYDELPPDNMDILEAAPEDPLPEAPLGRSHRRKHPTWKILENLPQPSSRLPLELPPGALPSPAPQPSSTVLPFVWEGLCTAPNSFGLFREYPCRPSHDPEDFAPTGDANITHSSLPTEPQVNQLVSKKLSSQAGVANVFSSTTSEGLMRWMWTGSSQKSLAEMDKLVHFLGSDNFQKEHLKNFDIRKETKCLDKLNEDDEWVATDVHIRVPDGQAHSTEGDGPQFTVADLHSRSIVEVIKATIIDPSSMNFHYTPFKQFWVKPSLRADDSSAMTDDNEPQRIYDEIFSSDAMIDEYMKVQNLPPIDDHDNDAASKPERVVLPLMFWSDSIHLADFGDASLWPVYMFFGNQSKYIQNRPQSGSCHHIAYIPKMPDSFKDFYKDLTGKVPDTDMWTHCQRELMHEVWRLLLDKPFLHAYKHGILIETLDGILRRFFPRIFTYSADYPEKVLLATIRNLGTCLCPRCLTPKKQVAEIGMARDFTRRQRDSRNPEPDAFDVQAARRAIYVEGKGVKSAPVERILQPKSLVPTTNTFYALTELGLNFLKALVIDLMHEVELGSWKNSFIHLVRILYALGAAVVQELDHRYRLVPTFGTSTIRRFNADASAMKKMAAQNYEDLLECSIPVFEGLLPEPHNSELMSLLFTFCEWHALAKLRIHTTETTDLLQDATMQLGCQLRRFQSFTCAAYATRELPKETDARGRHQAKKAAQSASEPRSGSTLAAQPPRVPKASNVKTFNLMTYKFHALGDYASTIRWYGTTNSYSTQVGELKHHRVKRFYGQTNKHEATHQITQLEHRERCLELGGKGESLSSSREPSQTKTTKEPWATAAGESAQWEPLPPAALNAHHHISESRNELTNITKFVGDHIRDPAVKDFMTKLQDHLLWHLSNPDLADKNHQYSSEERAEVHIVGNRLFHHHAFQVHYTTYDVRREYDSINPTNHPNIMYLSSDENAAHPFSYARVIGIFHVNVIYGQSPVPQTLQVLHVRRFQLDTTHRGGFKKKRLHRVHFRPESDATAFGFLDPDDVIHSCHLIPAFQYGPTEKYLSGPSIARNKEETDDWVNFYVNIFADRDMYMRYRGGGVGHYRVELPVEEGEVDLPAEPEVDPETGLTYGTRIIEGADESGEEIENNNSSSDSDEDEDEGLGPR